MAEEIKIDEINEEVTENEEVEMVQDPETGKWTTKEKLGTGFVLGTSAVGTIYLVTKIGKPVVEGTKKACKKVWNGVKSFFGKKEEVPEEEPAEEKPKKKASTKKKAAKKAAEETEK